VTFLHPQLLLLGPSAALLLTLALVLQWRRLGRLGQHYDGPVVRRIIPRSLQEFPTGRMVCLAVAALALATAGATPRPEAPAPPEPAPLLDIAVAVDVSLSMGANDVEPTRLGRARVVVERLTDALPSARIVLIPFADWPYTLVPPTDDPAVVRYFARSLSADLVSDRDQGTSFSTALAHARAALDARPGRGARRAILVVSDGGAHDDRAQVLRAAEAASEGGVSIWAAGLGTATGSPLSAGNRPLQDAAGRPVVARLEDGMLREIARAGGGSYEDVGDERGLEQLLQGLGAPADAARGARDEPIDLAFWLMLLSVPLLLAEAGLDAGRARARWKEGPRA